MKFKITMCALAFGLCATVQAGIIKGTVKGEGKALGEVIVTDGYSFSVTDKNGNYKIDLNDKAEFVYLLKDMLQISALVYLSSFSRWNSQRNNMIFH